MENRTLSYFCSSSSQASPRTRNITTATENTKPWPPLLCPCALVSIICKEILYRYTVSEGKRLDSKAVIANAWNHRSDALSSIGTSAGIGGAILLGEYGS